MSKVSLPKVNTLQPPISKLPFTEVDLRLLTKFKFPNCPKFYTSLGPKYNVIFNRYRSILPTTAHRFLLDIILRPVSALDEESFLAFLKEVGIKTLQYITSTGEGCGYSFFLEMQNLSGYDTILHRSADMRNDILPFVTTKPDNLTRSLKRNIIKTIDNLIIKKNPHTFYEYLSFRDNWNVDGASTVGVPLTLEFSDSKKTRKINTKYLSLLSFSNKTLYEECLGCKYEDNAITVSQSTSIKHDPNILELLDTKHFTPVNHFPNPLYAVCKPFPKKDEACKLRSVIGYDSFSYLNCDYLDSFIDYDGVLIWSTLGADPKKKQYVRKIINQAIRKKKYMLCVDQSAFDQHQSKESIMFALKYLFSRIYTLNPQTGPVIAAEINRLNHVKLIIDPQSGESRNWACGLLSGYKFTALLEIGRAHV